MSAPQERAGTRHLTWLTSRISTPFGLIFGAFAFLVTFGPGLLPRWWVAQGVVAGINTALGYVIGSWLDRIVKWVLRRTRIRLVAPPRTWKWARRVGWIVVIATVSIMWWMGIQDRKITAMYVGYEHATLREDGQAVLVAIPVTIGLVVFGLVVRAVWRGLTRWFATKMPRLVAGTLAAVALTVSVAVVVNEVAFRIAMDRVSQWAARVNEAPPENLSAPSIPTRSGSPGATQEWSKLGHNGQQFVSTGPGAAQITQVTGRPAIDPIRIYAGMPASRDVNETVDIALKEIQRTGALQRSALVVFATTGRGWVDRFNVESVEYLTGGDCASVAVQYSDLPSVVAFLADRDAPLRAGRVLFERVEALVAAQPESLRPKLYVTGESLGSMGGQSAFADSSDMLRRVAGAVWIGTPNSTPIWRDLTASRSKGSPEVAPVVGDGRHFRFATRAQDLTTDLYGRALGPWESPRVVYAQHPSDPIVWWSPSLIYRRPDWMWERVGPDVNSRFRWWPVVTFWQVSTDMLISADMPSGHGHSYQDEMVPIWAYVLGVETDRWPEIARAIRG